MKPRIAVITRKTLETQIELTLTLDGTGESHIETGIGFLDHLLESLTRHARFDLDLSCSGDYHIDDHHTAEDCGRVLGSAIDECLGDRQGIARFGSAYAPLDEALARSVIDLSGRGFSRTDLRLEREKLGDLSCENIPHFLHSMAMTARLTLHADILFGDNDHHKAEAAFKATALALRQAVVRSASRDIPSTKGTLSDKGFST